MSFPADEDKDMKQVPRAIGYRAALPIAHNCRSFGVVQAAFLHCEPIFSYKLSAEFPL